MHVTLGERYLHAGLVEFPVNFVMQLSGNPNPVIHRINKAPQFQRQGIVTKAMEQHMGMADQLLISANAERDSYELQKSRFTARSIIAIMEVTAGNRS